MIPHGLYLNKAIRDLRNLSWTDIMLSEFFNLPVETIKAQVTFDQKCAVCPASFYATTNKVFCSECAKARVRERNRLRGRKYREQLSYREQQQEWSESKRV
jgi:hypothetical protein